MKHNKDTLQDKLFLGIDIGSESSKAVLMEIDRTLDAELCYRVIKAQKIESVNAVNRTNIINIDVMSDIVANLFEAVTQGYKERIYTTFSIQGDTLQAKYNKINYPFSKHDRTIEAKDLLRAFEMAGNAQISSDREYIHIIPTKFFVNDNKVDTVPIGQNGTSLGIEVLLVSVLTESMKNVIHCVDNAEFECNYMCVGPFATGEAVLTQKEKKEGALVIDFGASMTTAAVFMDNKPVSLATVPLGGLDITRDMSQVLNISFDEAEKLKCTYGLVEKEYFSMFNPVIRIQRDEHILEFKIQEIYNIVIARTLEILALLKRQIHETVNSIDMPIVITGGAARILGLKQLSEKVFLSTTRISQPWNWGGPYTVYRDPSFSKVIGLCIAGNKHYQENGWARFIEQNKKSPVYKNSFGNSLKKVYENVSDRFKELLSFGNVE